MLKYDEIPHEVVTKPEKTTVVGDVDSFVEYIESGQAKRDWQERIGVLTEERDAFLRERTHIWSHIIIPRGPAP